MLAIDRGSQTNGLVPVSTRSFIVVVTMFLAQGTLTNAGVDNINICLF